METILITDTQRRDGALSTFRAAASRALTKKAAPKEVAAPAPVVRTELGRLEDVPLGAVVVGERFRRALLDIDRLAQSIAEIGLVTPIVVDESYNLIAGRRRLEAHRALGLEAIVARVIDPADPLLAQIDEDAERADLLPSEKLAVTEALRDALQEEARQRRRLGARFALAETKGRVDDLLADKVGVSRPTLQKIRAVCEAAATDPARFGPLMGEMDRTRKVDAAYKRLRAATPQGAPNEDEGTYRAIVFDEGWLAAVGGPEGPLLRLASALPIRKEAAGGALVLLPCAPEALPLGLRLLAGWGATYRTLLAWRGESDGRLVEHPTVCLVGSFGEPADSLSALTLAATVADGPEPDSLGIALQEVMGNVLVLPTEEWMPEADARYGA